MSQRLQEGFKVSTTSVTKVWECTDSNTESRHNDECARPMTLRHQGQTVSSITEAPAAVTQPADVVWWWPRAHAHLKDKKRDETDAISQTRMKHTAFKLMEQLVAPSSTHHAPSHTLYHDTGYGPQPAATSSTRMEDIWMKYRLRVSGSLTSPSEPQSRTTQQSWRSTAERWSLEKSGSLRAAGNWWRGTPGASWEDTPLPGTYHRQNEEAANIRQRLDSKTSHDRASRLGASEQRRDLPHRPSSSSRPPAKYAYLSIDALRFLLLLNPCHPPWQTQQGSAQSN